MLTLAYILLVINNVALAIYYKRKAKQQKELDNIMSKVIYFPRNLQRIP